MTFVTRNVQLKLIHPISFLSTRVEHQQLSVTRLSTSPPTTTGADILPYASIPSPPKHLILGHLPHINKFFTAKHKFHLDLQKEYGDIVKLYIPGKYDIVFCYNADDARTILERDGPMPINPLNGNLGYYRHVIRKDLFPHAGLMSQRGQDWQDFRMKVNPDLMKKNSMMSYLDHIETIANDLIHLFEKEKDGDNRIRIKTVFNAQPILQRWSLESVGFIFLGARIGTLKENVAENSDGMTLIKHVNTSLNEMFKMMLYPPIWKYITVPYYKRYNEATDEIFKITMKYIEASLKNNSGDNIILSKLADRFDNDRALINVMAFEAIIGGTTTATTAANMLYHLASNPDKQELLYQEILATIGPTGSITEPALNKMKYLSNCLEESQRLFSGENGRHRITQQDMTLCGYHIPQGTHVAVSQSMTRDERFFHTPNAFLPERWDRSARGGKFHPFASLPFGLGPRSCVGKRIARGELYVLITKVLQKYRLEYEGDEFVNKLDKDLVIKLINRN